MEQPSTDILGYSVMIEVPRGPIDLKVLQTPLKHLEGEAKWKDITELVQLWAARNPRGWRQQKQWTNDTSIYAIHSGKKGKLDSSIGQYGKVGPDTRISVLMHPELMEYISVFYPRFLTTKDELDEFKHRFPVFTAVRKKEDI